MSMEEVRASEFHRSCRGIGGGTYERGEPEGEGRRCMDIRAGLYYPHWKTLDWWEMDKAVAA
jgi:hypothetical protein